MSMETIEQLGDDIGTSFEVAEEDILIRGLYEIAPLVRRASESVSGGYGGKRFSRSRHHQSVPERVVVGMNAEPAVDLLPAA